MPHQHLILDTAVAAVVITILGLTSLAFIQEHSASNVSHLLARLRRDAWTAARLFASMFPSLFVFVCAIAIWSYLIHITFNVPPPDALPADIAVPIVADVSGRIEKIYVMQGSIVHAGDPIIQLDTGGLILKKQRLESRIHLVELYAAADRRDLTMLYGELEQTQLEMNRLTITSPEEGQIIALEELKIGERLERGRAVAALY